MRNKKLTRDLLKSIKPSPSSGTKEVHWDIEIAGLGAYRTSKGYISFLYQYRSPSDQRTRSAMIGRFGEITLDQARDIARDYAYDRRRGIDPVLERRRIADEERNRDELILAKYVIGYLERRATAGKPVSDRDVAIIHNDVLRLLGDKRIDILSITDVEDFATELGRRAPSARRTGLVQLKAILNEAKKRAVIVTSPADAVDTPKSGERERVLSEWEMQRYLEAAHDIGDVRGEILELLLRLLKRKNEVAAITWEELDIAKSEWRLPASRTKNREAALIQLPPQAMQIILRQQPDPRLRRGFVFTLNGRTFPQLGGQVKEMLDANMDRRVELADLRDGTAHRVEHFTIHDIRTAGGTRNQQAPLSASSAIIDRMLLHSPESKVTKIYQRAPLVPEVGEALCRWNDWLDQLMSNSGAWPGERSLEKLSNAEAEARVARFREGWPERTDQKRAREQREAETADGEVPRGRRAREAAARKAARRHARA